MRNNTEVLLIKNNQGGFELIKIDEILLACSDQNYVHIYLAYRKITQHMSFSELAAWCYWDKMLMKIHRQYMLRFDCIHEIMTGKKEGDYVTLKPQVQEQLQKLGFAEKTIPLGAEGKILLL